MFESAMSFRIIAGPPIANGDSAECNYATLRYVFEVSTHI
jgi:hypothetical protein